MERKATTTWKGTGKEGGGTISTQSPTLKNVHYTYNTRFENEGGTNPEELIAAAHSGCFTMKLAFELSNAGFTPESIQTDCTVGIENGAITGSSLDVKVKAAGLNQEKLNELAEAAKQICPVSKALKIPITMKTTT